MFITAVSHINTLKIVKLLNCLCGMGFAAFLNKVMVYNVGLSYLGTQGTGTYVLYTKWIIINMEMYRN